VKRRSSRPSNAPLRIANCLAHIARQAVTSLPWKSDNRIMPTIRPMAEHAVCIQYR